MATFSREYPPEACAGVQYGLAVRALVTKLSLDHKMPLEQIRGVFGDLYGYELNSETVEIALEESVMAQLKRAKTAHFDETGLRVVGKLQWFHIAGNAFYACLFAHEKRGQAACAATTQCR